LDAGDLATDLVTTDLATFALLVLESGAPGRFVPVGGITLAAMVEAMAGPWADDNRFDEVGTDDDGLREALPPLAPPPPAPVLAPLTLTPEGRSLGSCAARRGAVMM